jgi:hypothetical protein
MGQRCSTSVEIAVPPRRLSSGPATTCSRSLPRSTADSAGTPSARPVVAVPARQEDGRSAAYQGHDLRMPHRSVIRLNANVAADQSALVPPTRGVGKKRDRSRHRPWCAVRLGGCWPANVGGCLPWIGRSSCTSWPMAAPFTFLTDTHVGERRAARPAAHRGGHRVRFRPYRRA